MAVTLPPNLFAPKNPITGLPMSVQPSPTTGTSASSVSDPNNSGWADLASIAGAFGSGQKADRALQGQFTQNYDKLMLDAAANRRTDESDATKKLAQSAYTLNGGSHFAPGSMSLNGKTYQLSDFGMGPQAPSDAQKAGASTLQDQMLTRLQPGGSYTPQPLNSYALPGTAEKVSDYGAVALGAVGAIDKFLGGSGSTTGGITGLIGKYGSKAVTSAATAVGGAGLASTVAPYTGSLIVNGTQIPGAAAASGGMGAGGAAALGGELAGAGLGIYGLAKNHSMGLDIGSGALTGGSIGSMVMPGIGTAVGAGIGAGVGAIRHAIGGPDTLEKNARGVMATDVSQLTAGATPAEQAQAKAAGWGDPNQALAQIVMADKLQAAGKDPALAGQIMKSMMDASHHDPAAMTKAFAQYQQALG